MDKIFSYLKEFGSNSPEHEIIEFDKGDWLCPSCGCIINKNAGVCWECIKKTEMNRVQNEGISIYTLLSDKIKNNNLLQEVPVDIEISERFNKLELE